MSTRRRTLGVHSQPRPLGPNGEKLCFNCRGPLPKGRAYNCCTKCSEEWRCKTSPGWMRHALLKRDHGICAGCGIDTIALKAEYDAIRRIDEHGRAWNDPAACSAFLKAHGIPYGRGPSDFWDADHITPVVEGGGECDLSNLRTLCIPCHQKATKELAARLAGQRKDAKLQAACEVLNQPLQFGNLAPKAAARTIAKLQSANAETLRPSSTNEKSTDI
jgi:5-methylcytosine-specific restriction protein A